jgi:hypothetical protein
MTPQEQRQGKGELIPSALSPTVWEKMREYVQEVAHQIEESVQHVMVDEQGCEQDAEPQAS